MNEMIAKPRIVQRPTQDFMHHKPPTPRQLAALALIVAAVWTWQAWMIWG